MGRLFVIHRLTRVDQAGGEESLEFTTGINVIVGPPNTGKTQWLRMLDHILGDDDRADQAFDEQLAAKYVELRAEITIGDRRSTLARRWHDPRLKSKIVVDGVPQTIDDFNAGILERLAIPIIKFPQGDPHGPRTWPTLGWRSLLRHVYRRQGSWADFASNQFESERHAALLQLLGAAAKVFVAQFRELVNSENQLRTLHAQKEHFQTALNLVTREMLNEDDALSLTDKVIDDRLAEITQSISAIEQQRAVLVEAVAAEIGANNSASMTSEVAELRAERERVTQLRVDARVHLAELQALLERLEAEVGRLTRARLAGSVFGRLKVTHCPVCDQVVQQESPEYECYLCHQYTEPVVVTDAKKRFAFEQSQIEGEIAEAREVIASTTEAERGFARSLRTINDRLAKAEATLAPLRARAASIMPPEIAALDQELGAKREQIKQMVGFRAVLGKRQDLARQLDALQAEIAKLESAVNATRGSADLEQLGDIFGDRMNDYLTRLNAARANSWTQREVRVDLHQRGSSFRVGDGRWNKKLGGTLTLYFLLAYNYALLSLYPEPWSNCPSLSIIDFPAKFDDGSATADKENFVLSPFAELLQQDSMKEAQVIITGNSFTNLAGNRVELSHVWK